MGKTIYFVSNSFDGKDKQGAQPITFHQPSNVDEMQRALKTGQKCYQYDGKFVMMSRQDAERLALKPVPLHFGFQSYQALTGRDGVVGQRLDRSLGALNQRSAKVKGALLSSIQTHSPKAIQSPSVIKKVNPLAPKAVPATPSQAGNTKGSPSEAPAGTSKIYKGIEVTVVSRTRNSSGKEVTVIQDSRGAQKEVFSSELTPVTAIHAGNHVTILKRIHNSIGQDVAVIMDSSGIEKGVLALELVDFPEPPWRSIPLSRQSAGKENDELTPVTASFEGKQVTILKKIHNTIGEEVFVIQDSAGVQKGIPSSSLKLVSSPALKKLLEQMPAKAIDMFPPMERLDKLF